MPIKASSARHVDALIADLRADDSVKRDAAVARLTVIGTRAVDRLLGVVTATSEPAAARVAAFRALEGIDDPRTLAPALAALRRGPADVATAAVQVARTYLHGPHGVAALDALTALALDRHAEEAAREAAVRALDVLDPGTVDPIRQALLVDPSARLRALAQGSEVPEAPAATSADGSWLDRIETSDLPEDAEAVRHEIVRRRADVPLARLHRSIERIRERELTVPAPRQRAWMAARAAAHLALAQRGSRVALYDLREMLAQADGPLPWSDLLSAIAAIGDADSLETLAELHARAGAQPDVVARHVADAFRAIAAREKVTARSAVARKIARKWPDAWKSLA